MYVASELMLVCCYIVALLWHSDSRWTSNNVSSHSFSTGLPVVEENTISSCLGSEVIFTCTVNQTDTIQWEIDFLTIPDINRVGYFQNDPVGQRLQAFSEDIVINFNLTSKSPLTSTMTTIASPDLYGAKVSCLDGLSSEAQVDSHVIDAVLGPSNVSEISVTATEFENTTTFDALITWKLQHSQETLDTNFTVTVSPPVSFESTFITPNTSLPIQSVSFNQKYNISVVTSSCFGNSTPVEIHLGQCQFPSLQTNVSIVYYRSGTNGTYIIYGCHQVPSSTVKSECTSRGNWNPNPAHHLCKHALDPGIHENSITVAEDVHDGLTAELVSSISVGMIVLVLAIVIITTCALFRSKKHGINRRSQTDQRQNEYSESEHNNQHHQYQENGLVYASIGPSRNLVEMPRVESVITLYSEVLVSQQQTDNTSQSSKTCTDNDDVLQVDKLLNLDSLLIQLRPHVTPKWYQFGVAIGIPQNVLQQYLNFPPDECMLEMLDYWIRNHPQDRKPTWRAVANALSDIEFYQLSESIINSYQTGQLPVKVDGIERNAFVSFHGDNSEVSPPPLPPKPQERAIDTPGPALPPKPKQR